MYVNIARECESATHARQVNAFVTDRNREAEWTQTKQKWLARLAKVGLHTCISVPPKLSRTQTVEDVVQAVNQTKRIKVMFHDQLLQIVVLSVCAILFVVLSLVLQVWRKPDLVETIPGEQWTVGSLQAHIASTSISHNTLRSAPAFVRPAFRTNQSFENREDSIRSAESSAESRSKAAHKGY